MKAIAEAPCKVIIIGEHFVVHGAKALAAAVDRRTRVETQYSSKLEIRSNLLSSYSDSRIKYPIMRIAYKIAKDFNTKPRFYINITSNIPEGYGLGSSASTMVAVAASICKLIGANTTNEDLIRYAMIGESLIHGKPSGIDPTTCALGKLILFRIGEKPEVLELSSDIELLVIFSGIKRSTKRLIERISGVRGRLPNIFNELAKLVSMVSDTASKNITQGDIMMLGKLMTLNHSVLSSLGASNSNLDRIVDLSLSLGCYGAKLTGAGGGGSVIAVPPSGRGDQVLEQMRRYGYEGFKARLPTDGVRTWLE